MTGSASLPEIPRDNNEGVLELNKDLETMIENVENISVQVTWMAYDLVALRTSPELGSSLQKLEEAYRRCRAAVFGVQQPEKAEVLDATAAAHI
nr:synaptonemal complex central element protein 3 [Labrus bergylta]